MLQKLISVQALAAIFLFGIALLVAQKTQLGILSSKRSELTSANYPTYSELFASRPTQLKLASAVEEIKRQKESKKKLVEAKKPQIASQTIFKPVATSVPSDIEATIRRYALEYGANPEVMIAIAKCESGFRAEALSPSGAYGGMYQFVSSTWVSNRRAMGLDENPDLRFNGEEAIKTAAFKMGRDGYSAWPVCSQKALAKVN